MSYDQCNILISSAIAEVYKNEGNDECRKNKFSNAINFYSKGINVNCKDKELNAKLYINRAISHFYLGENFHFCGSCVGEV